MTEDSEMKKVLIVLMMMCLGLAGTALAKTGEVLYEHWDGIGGVEVADLTGNANYPDNPTGSWMLTNGIDGPVDRADDFGGRITGYIIAPETANYTFLIVTDDKSELWLSTDTDPANVRLVARGNDWAGYNSWGDEHNEVVEADIALQGGAKYYFSGIYKEGGGGDNIQVGWISDGTVIGTSYSTVAAEYTASDPYGLSKAVNPSPAEGAGSIDPAAAITLAWDPPTVPPSGPVVEYDVYLSTSADIADPNEGDTPVGTVSAAGALELVIAGGTLANDTRYYWRVDTIVQTDKPSTDPNNAVSDLWYFDTITYKPVIVTQPANALVWPGETVVLAVEATSGELDDRGALTYQWHDSTAALDGETGSELVIANAGDGDAEDYYCVVSNGDGDTASDAASLVIKHLIGHWTFDEGAGSIAHDTSPDGPNADATMYLNQAGHPDPNAHWEPNGMIGACYDGFGGSWLDTFLLAADLGLEGNNPKSVSVWVFPRAMNDGGIWDVGRRSAGQDWCLRTESESQGDHGWRVQYWGGDYNFNTLNAWNTMGHSMPSLNAWIHFVLTHDGAKTRVYANGRLIVDWDKTIDTGDDFTFRIGQYGPNNEKFDGLIDDMRLYDFALNHLEAAVLYTNVVDDDSVCLGNNPLDLDGNCRIGIGDLALFAAEYLECNIVPDCKP